MARYRDYQVALFVVLILSAGLFLATSEAWRREPALELAVLSIVAIAALEAASGEKKK